ncbi:hypothetical protein O181_115088 [Austropuccinia psidii MF-1]|uniref:Uncharacterized protein n=1 Tax=Austropuccinia psidii MF-1 TaxID=1389203 RepID=A0A9Q3PV68_9BASI|nr:hypothetical protein [Austropuccinia psidii MF-1]
MSSKLTELTEFSPSAPPPSVLCGSGNISQLASPWSRASSCHFYPAQPYDAYKAVEKPCCQIGPLASNLRRYLWSKNDGPFGKEFPVSEAPTPDGTSGYSNFTSQQLQPGASASRRREELSPLPFPAAQVFQKRDFWPIQVTREDPSMESENQDAVARLFRRVDRRSRQVIEYPHDRTIPGTAYEEMASIFPLYEDELINYVQRTFDCFGRDN